MKNLTGEFIHYIFAISIILMIIFAVSGVGIKILNEIYKKAIEYKEENDLLRNNNSDNTASNLFNNNGTLNEYEVMQ